MTDWAAWLSMSSSLWARLSLTDRSGVRTGCQADPGWCVSVLLVTWIGKFREGAKEGWGAQHWLRHRPPSLDEASR